ncbi:MAG TPA: AMP-binding protein, partial [Roseiarcus sp.]|nr:AMP-binding protein [Roseiarcus sp.]
MYPGQHAVQRADQPAVIMAESGETVTYCELEARSNRLAHLLRAIGLKRLDHYAIFMENHPRYVECCAAGERSGLYFTCINSFLTANELAYIINNSLSKVLITSEAKREVAIAALRDCPKVELCLVADGAGEGSRVRSLSEATAEFPATPIGDESLGTAMLYSSGTTGRPKGVLRPLPDQPPDEPLTALVARLNVWRFREGQIYLSPAPLYHSAPLAGVGGTL